MWGVEQSLTLRSKESTNGVVGPKYSRMNGICGLNHPLKNTKPVTSSQHKGASCFSVRSTEPTARPSFGLGLCGVDSRA